MARSQLWRVALVVVAASVVLAFEAEDRTSVEMLADIPGSPLPFFLHSLTVWSR